MKTEKLFELLTLVDGITSRRWETVTQLVDVIESGGATIKDKKWGASYKQNNPDWYPLNLDKIGTWSTYGDTCVDLYFSNDTTDNNGHPNNQLVCKVKIYDGEMLDGRRKELRFEALIWLPTAFLHTIEQMIERKFDLHLGCVYEKHLETQRALWIENMKSEILNR